jgi:putative flavoprotein involved in K+ transport
MQLFGRLNSLEGSRLHFGADLRANLDAADAVYNRINASIDKYIAEHNINAPEGAPYKPLWAPEMETTELDLAQSGITSIIWCIGFQPDFSWVDVPVFNGRSYPGHTRGVTAYKGLYFLGLPWLHTWGSGRFSGISRDARYVVENLSAARPVELRLSKTFTGSL